MEAASRYRIAPEQRGVSAPLHLQLPLANGRRVELLLSDEQQLPSPRPTSPHDLDVHDCISLRLPTHGGLLPWEFKRGNRTVNAHVKGRLVFNQSDLIVYAALAGHGMAWLSEDIVQKHVAAGRLLTALDDWSITCPGYHLYYASRRSSPALSMVVEALRYTKAGRSSRVL